MCLVQTTIFGEVWWEVEQSGQATTPPVMEILCNSCLIDLPSNATLTTHNQKFSRSFCLLIYFGPRWLLTVKMPDLHHDMCCMLFFLGFFCYQYHRFLMFAPVDSKFKFHLVTYLYISWGMACQRHEVREIWLTDSSVDRYETPRSLASGRWVWL